MALSFSSLGFCNNLLHMVDIIKRHEYLISTLFFQLQLKSVQCCFMSTYHLIFSVAISAGFLEPLHSIFLKNIRRAPRDLVTDTWPITKLIRVTLDQSRDLPGGTSGRLWARRVPWLQSKRYTRADLVSFPRCFKPALTELTHSLTPYFFFLLFSFSLSSLFFFFSSLARSSFSHSSHL